MRAIVTGQVGVDKGPYLAAVKKMAAERGIDLCVCNVGEMMYKEAPDVPKGRILNLPITRLNTLRRDHLAGLLTAADVTFHAVDNDRLLVWSVGSVLIVPFLLCLTSKASPCLSMNSRSSCFAKRLENCALSLGRPFEDSRAPIRASAASHQACRSGKSRRSLDRRPRRSSASRAE